MPKNVKSLRGMSGKRKERQSNYIDDQEETAIENIDPKNEHTREQHDAAVALASSHGALRRLADIAHYMNPSFVYDISIVEADYGGEIEREKEIRRLKEALSALTHSKCEETEQLRRENKKIKDEQEACDQQRTIYQTKREDLEAEHREAEARREEEYRKMTRDDKARTQKYITAKEAEIEQEWARKFAEMEKRLGGLSTTNQDLRQTLSELQAKLERKKT